MTSSFTLNISGFEVWSNKQEIPAELLTVFTEADRKESRIPDPCDRSRRITAYTYSETASSIRQRLDIMGFTISKCEKAYNAFNKLKRAQFRRRQADSSLPQILRETRPKLLSFNRWKEAMRQAIDHKIYEWNVEEFISVPGTDFARLIAKETGYDYAAYSFPVVDIRYFLRAVLEVCSPNESVVLDYTDLVYAGWYSRTAKPATSARERIAWQYSSHEKIVVVTEGSSDSRILSKAIRLLYHHLADYYSFSDFAAANAQGSAGDVIRTVKAFISNGIKNRVIGLLDNDAAAEDAMRGLSRVSLPKNVKILRLPDTDIAKMYPTIGPQGPCRHGR